MEVLRSSVVNDLRSVTTKTGECGSKLTTLSTKFVSVYKIEYIFCHLFSNV